MVVEGTIFIEGGCDVKAALQAVRVVQAVQAAQAARDAEARPTALMEGDPMKVLPLDVPPRLPRDLQVAQTKGLVVHNPDGSIRVSGASTRSASVQSASTCTSGSRRTSRRTSSTVTRFDKSIPSMPLPEKPRGVVSMRLGAAQVRMQRCLAPMVEGRGFMTFSVLLTIYALIGSDLRLITTDKPADIGFNVLTVLCLSFFAIEIVLASIAKMDYFLGFFFLLDVVSTASLILDLTWVADQFAANELGFGANARSGRTARLGASVGRVVRVLRLIRIVKLYKVVYEKKVKHEAPPPRRRISVTGASEPGEAVENWGEADDWDADGEDVGKNEDNTHESLVGKRLVALTTQRVIILVLVMLIGLPMLSVDRSNMVSTSATWGAEVVWTSYRKMLAGNITHSMYEQDVLKYMYYHNWYSGNGECTSDADCANSFLSQAFWVGVGGRIASISAAVGRIRPQTVDQWETAMPTQARTQAYGLGSLPKEAQDSLTSNWTVACTHSGYDYIGTSIIGQKIDGRVDYPVRCLDDLRPQEGIKIVPSILNRDQFSDLHIAFFFDTRPFVRQDSAYNIGTTAFICVVLCLGSMVFSKDANELVLKPVESMICKVNQIRDDPLIAMKMADAEYEVEQRRKHKVNRQFVGSPLQQMWRMVLSKLGIMELHAEKPEIMETAVLEKTIIKLGSLLALGFGEAGVNIVRNNMRGLDSAGINAMIPGARVDCVIGSARIRDFSSATEVLQGKVMTFVNQIAEIVHGLVNEYHGAPNKNNGDTFLLIWRTSGLQPEKQTKLADMSIVTFARILAAVHLSPVLAQYRAHPGLQQRLGSNCRVNLSFGLHYGWAIEGAVGSEFKIDASYISPNVSITESLERATQVYNVNLIASETVLAMCSKAIAAKCRLIDKVIITGSKRPLELYVIDLDVAALHPRERRQAIHWTVRQRIRARQLLEEQKRRKWSEEVPMVAWLDSSREIGMMRRNFTTEFFQLFNMGYQNYSQGEWSVARRLLKTTHDMLGYKDGPSGALLQFMEAPYQFEAPEGWQGVHPLDPRGPTGDGGADF